MDHGIFFGLSERLSSRTYSPDFLGLHSCRHFIEEIKDENDRNGYPVNFQPTRLLSGNDMGDLIEVLIQILWWPYDAWKSTTENSRVGTSPQEEKTIRFWATCAIIGAVILSILGTVLWIY
ncbi:MAG: hypothetical protein PHD76_07450 [Methylacidiphilales bacterium]|nr:hypothetical protein [Candidatus Methylacidiphilales bacterium]